LSRRWLTILPALGAQFLATAHGQVGADAAASRAIETARQAIGPISSEQRLKACRAVSKEDEIVVCAPDDGAQWRVQSSNEVDPTSRQATRDGVPRAPDLAPKYGGVHILAACLLPPCPPPPMYMIDLSSIPETPRGSDAEKVAQGEMRDR
jgi:hypothetical protein